MAKQKSEKVSKQETPAQRLSGIIKSCRNIMRKDKGMVTQTVYQCLPGLCF